MEISVLGIDLAKEVFHLHGVDSRHRVVLRKKVRRAKLLGFVRNLKPCVVGIESCGGAHYWAREFKKVGHTVRMIAPQFVKPFVKSNKNDMNDAEGIVEAITRPSMRFVPVKEPWQQDIQNIHRVRQRLVVNRVQVSNELRGLLLEYGITIARNRSQFKKTVPLIIADETNGLSSIARTTFQRLYSEFLRLEDEVLFYDQEIRRVFESSNSAKRIEKIPGVGVVTATAVVAAVGSAREFKNGRQFAAWLGLVPRQASTGGKTILKGISKRGDVYLRSLLVHGARASLRWAPQKTDKTSKWATEKLATKGWNKSSVALANKNARTIWAVLAHNQEYKVVA